MTNRAELNDELHLEYDETLLKNGVRGKYAGQYAAGTNIVRLEADIAAAFPNEQAVNEALRSLLKERYLIEREIRRNNHAHNYWRHLSRR